MDNHRETILEFHREHRFRENSSIRYPPFCTVYFEKYFYEYIAKAYLEKRIGPAIYEHYIPVFWTEIQISKRYDDTLANKVRTPDNDFLWKLWGLLSTMSKQRNYFTVVQHDDGITMSSKPANLITFAMGGVGNIPLPLTYNDTPEFNTYKNKDKTVFCSFVGSLTHPCREHMVRLLENKPGVFIVTNEWTNDIKEENQLLYLNVMSRSRFTLAPRGYGKTSFRLYEALRLGSVPIYIYDDKWLPYTDKIEWEKMAVLVHLDELDSLYDKIRGITDEEVTEMVRYYEEHSHLFSYDGMCEYIINSFS